MNVCVPRRYRCRAAGGAAGEPPEVAPEEVAASSASRRVGPMRLSRTAPLVRGREPAGDARPGQVNHGVHAGEQVRGGLVRLPLAFVRALRRVTDELDHAVAAGGQQGGQRGPDEAAGPGDRDGHAARCGAAGPSGGRPGPRPARGAGRRTSAAAPLRDRGLHVVADPGLVFSFGLALGAEQVGVPPGQHLDSPADTSSSTNWCGGS